MRTTIASLSLFLLAAVAVGEDRPGTPPLGKDDFLPRALAQTMACARFSDLVENRAADADVKKFGKELWADADEARKKLEKKVEEAGKERKTAVAVGLEKGHQLALARLTVMTGESFDRAYVDQIIRDLEEMNKLMEKHEKSDFDGVRDSVKANKEKVAKHLKRARELQKKVGKPEEKK